MRPYDPFINLVPKTIYCRKDNHHYFGATLLQSKISSRIDYFAWSMRKGNDKIESDLRCIDPLTPSGEGFY